MTPDQFRTARLAKGMTQAKAAAYLGTDRNTVSRYERGERAIPPLVAIRMAGPPEELVMAVAAAQEAAQCPHREGPFGGYDYGHNEAFYGPAPEAGRYVVRDFRDPSSPTWGKGLHYTNDSAEHDAVFARMTRDHIARAAITATLAYVAKLD